MSDNILSQEEIEALLRGEEIHSTKTDTSSQTNQNPNNELSEMEKDALGEVGNISFGSSATALSSLLGHKVEITTPSITVVDRNMLMAEFIHPYIVVQVEYTEGLNGMNLLIIKQRDAAIIADLMLGEDGLQPPEELNEIRFSAVQEAMNQMMGSAATSMSTVFNKRVDISPPSIDLIDMPSENEISYIPENEPMIKVSFKLKVGNLIDSHIMQLFPLQFGKNLVTTLMGMDVANEAAITMETPILPPTRNQQQQSENSGQESQSFEKSQSDSQTTKQSFDAAQQIEQTKEPQPTVHVQQAQFASFDTPSFDKTKSNNLNMLLDIPLQVTVELGRTKRSVKEILEMSSGYIIELDKLAGEPVDILVNNRHIARGEVVVIDENFGVRITDVLSQKERLNNLR
ncbi:flagellar motor switch phosphatase FliY [Sporosarcina thermotolerans]|uniref:Flagellar motor switch phosphatase FliY n=1 Tax=Sporosarcina thermotolerans TaxID=633404 RepID=A0AAW9A4N2_9BACL|nr:flagellar motor switch phosphatase FliY [Sporosarcina thermotolerans]MDW0115724.1 flagellar motor switch phosphatase FliY [Sporosarcina thermotolerans]